MRRLVLAVVLGAAALLLPPGEPAVAQGTTFPTPDFDHDGFGDVLEDLGAGAPGETVGGSAGAGAASVLFGSAGGGGLGGAGSQFHYQRTGLGGSAESGDAGGAALG